MANDKNRRWNGKAQLAISVRSVKSEMSIEPGFQQKKKLRRSDM